MVEVQRIGLRLLAHKLPLLCIVLAFILQSGPTQIRNRRALSLLCTHSYEGLISHPAQINRVLSGPHLLQNMDYLAIFDGMFNADFSADDSALKDAISSLSDVVRLYDDKRVLLDALLRSQSLAFELTFCDSAEASAELRSSVVRDMLNSRYISSLQHDFLVRLGRFIVTLPPTIHLSGNAFKTWADIQSLLALDKGLAQPDSPISPTSSNTSKRTTRQDTSAISPMIQSLLSAAEMSSMKIQTNSDIIHLRETVCSSVAKKAEVILFALPSGEVRNEVQEWLRQPRAIDSTPAPASREAPKKPDASDDRDTKSDTCQNPEPSDFFKSFARPITATLDQTIDGVWPVVIASKALDFFKQSEHGDGTAAEMVERKIEELASGEFTRSNCLLLLKQHFPVPLLKAKASKSLRIIYQIDCGYPVPNWEGGDSSESQCIKIYDVCNAQDVKYGLWTSIAKELARRGSDYHRRCKPQRTPGSPIILPTTFPRSSLNEDWIKSDEASSEAESIDESQFLELHRILAVEKFILFRKTLFEEARRDPNRNYPFALHPNEYDIMTHQSSCLVLGRSGTGKTTTMIFKMIDVEDTGIAMGTRHRQVFVTQSATLAKKVREYYRQLATHFGPSAPQDHAGSSPKTSGLVDFDDTVTGQDGLPSRFGDLKPEQFPLFITFDQLCQLLEGDVIAYALDLQKTRQEVPPDVTRVRMQSSRSRLTFDRFLSVIWPRLHARNGLSPALVFSEFIGVIKGCEETLSTSAGYLARRAYEELSSRRASTFADNRSEIYSLFEKYLKIVPYKFRDDAERTRDLLDALKFPIPLPPIDFLYVDEVQDNLVIDVALLRHLCRNPHGTFLAGDTAQTISVGSSFRFKDMKALLYRLERKDSIVARGLRKPVDPKFFQLSVNYRSHGGIVDAAAFFVHLMTKLFPGCVDILAREVAKVAGRHRRPMFFSKRQGNDDLMRLISDEGTGVIELGANQAIIVRDDDAASRLLERIGDKAIVLTIYESKGMEFNDVLLYDFFADSAAGSADWRALVRSIHWTANHVPVIGDINRARHAILQSELKCLYVAFTRARERVCIWETSDHASEMEELMCEAELCVAHDPAQPVPQIGRSTSPKEWNEQGRAYFSKRLYTQAATCFQKAGEHWWKDVATTYAFEQASTRLELGDTTRLSKLLSAGCEFERLASLPGVLPSDAKILFQHAGECYRLAERFDMAARCFLSGERFEDAAVDFRHAGLFDDALGVIQQHEEAINNLVVETVKNVARVEFVKKNQLKKAKNLFRAPEEFSEFMQDHGFERQQAVFLRSESMFDELGDLHRTQGELHEAIHLFVQSKRRSSQMKAASCLIDAFRASMPFPLPSPLPENQDLVLLSKSVPRDVFESSKLMDELDLFIAISGPYKGDQMVELATRFLSQGNTRCSLLAFDAWEKLNPQEVLDTANSDLRVPRLLKVYRQFGRAVRAVCGRRTFLDDSATLTLYGLRSASDAGTGHASPDGTTAGSSNVVVMPSSFIYDDALGQRPISISGSNLQPDLQIPVQTAEELIRRRHTVDFNKVLDNLHKRALRSPAFNICIHFLVNGSCARVQCPSRHIYSNKLTLNDVNGCFNLHLLLISALDNYAVLSGDSEDRSRVAMQSNRLARLFELCYPVSGCLINLSDLKKSLMPDLTETLPTLKAWMQEVFAAQRPARSTRFFLTNLLQSSLLASLLDYDNFMRYTDRGVGTLLSDDDRKVAERERLMRTISGKEKPAISCALRWFDQERPSRHNNGVHFVEHAVRKTPAIEITALVGLMEEIGAQLVWNEYSHSRRIDGLTLPVSWLLRVQQRGSSENLNGAMPHKFASHIAALLQILFGQIESGRLMLRGKFLYEVLDKFTRNQCISRLCRLLVLLGINSSSNLPSTIWKCLDVVLQGNNSMGLDKSSYFSATTWGELTRIATSSLGSTPFDEMVVVFESDSPQARRSSIGIRTIVAKSVQEVKRRLRLDPDSLLAFKADTTPTTDGQDPSQTVDDLPQKSGDPSAPEAVSNDKDDDDEATPAGGFTNEERKAVRVMEKHYCRRIVRAREGPLYDACDKMARSLEAKTRRRYCVYLRGPMPYVVEYLQTLALKCQDVLKDVKKQITQSDHRDLERLFERRQTAQHLEEYIRNILTKLRPTSAFHKLASIPKLVEIVRKIPGIRDRLAKLHHAFHDKDIYNLGVKCIIDRNKDVVVTHTDKKPKPPRLNIEDV